MKNLILKTQKVTLAQFLGILLGTVAIVAIIMFIVNTFVQGIGSYASL